MPGKAPNQCTCAFPSLTPIAGAHEPCQTHASRLAQLTPPPSRPRTPRRSLDDPAAALAARSTSRSRLTLGSASEALTHALSSIAAEDSDGDADPDDTNPRFSSREFFPNAMYRMPSRSTSRYSVSSTSRRTSAETPSSSSTTTPTVPAVPRLPPAHSSGMQSPPLGADYAPLSAGFARLNRGARGGVDSGDGLPSSRSSIDAAEMIFPRSSSSSRVNGLAPRTSLEASLFRGPA